MRLTHISRLGVLAVALAATSCGSAVRQGSGTSFLIINSLEAASGAEPDDMGGTLHSDVITIVDDVPTTFNDIGNVSFSLGLKDPGSAASPNSPTQNQLITIDRYRVQYIRTDGRNTPGVDVPYGFDGGITLTVGEGGAEGSFQIVRHIAKQEAPLGTLRNGVVIISTIAEVTFYGRDQTGREVTATGRISVDFGNFGDPE
jgi:hypothetical protein